MKRYVPVLSAIILVTFLLILIVMRGSRGVEETASGGSRPAPAAPSSVDRSSRPRPPPSAQRYRVITEQLTWSQARQRCEELGGHLATLMTEEESQFVASLLPSGADPGSTYWIGLMLDRQRGCWRWITGDVAKTMLWAKGAPSDTAVGSFAALSEDGRWVDLESGQKLYSKIAGFLCEWDEAPTATGASPAGAASFRGHRYAYFRERLTWFWAKTRCEQVGGHLVSISSKEENEFVASLLPRGRDYDTFYWIGLVDASRKRSWAWTTGEPFSYQDWRPGEPNNGGGNECYVAMTSSPDGSVHGTWNDFEGPHRSHEIIVGFVCEWDGPNPPAAGIPVVQQDDILVKVGAPVPLHKFQGHRFALLTESVTWSQAEAKCREWGGQLLTAASKEEWDFILSRVLPQSPVQSYYWIGLRDTEKQGEWCWITGGKPDFIQWLPGEPNNFEGKEHYAAIFASSDPLQHGRLNDLEGPDCVHDVVVGYICKFQK